MSEAAACSGATEGKKRKTGPKAQTLDLAKDKKYQELVTVVAKSVTDAASTHSGPMETLEHLRAERRAAKKASQEKTKELKAYGKRVARLQARAAKLSDDGLLVEFARRQAAKERKAQTSAEARGK